MFSMFKTFTAIVACVALSVQASPLSRRDVIVPKITSPTKDSVWPVGSTQTVTWDTSNFPPVSQITNILGKVILGFDENDSLNLDLDHPLAQNFNLTDGSVKITVPNVKPRDDYLIVLFGDSGNTSPAFSITKISPSNSTSTPTNPPTPPFTGTTITGGQSTTTPDSITAITGSATTQGGATDTTTTSALETTSTAPPSTSTEPSSTSTSTTSTATNTALGSNTSSAGRSIHHSSLKAVSLCIGAMLSAFVLL